MNQRVTKWLCCLLVPVLLFGLTGASLRAVSSAEAAPVSRAGEEEIPSVESGIAEISKYGNLVLTVSPASMRELGYEPADIIRVTIGSETLEMPIGKVYADTDSGQPICIFSEPAQQGGTPTVILAVNGGDLTTALGIAEREETEEAPGYRWVWNEGYDEDTTVYLSMVEKQGYADAFKLHQVWQRGSLERSDYPDLTDEEFANFREIGTTGMGTGTLYRSSSPINPKINRNREADSALLAAGVSTVMNMADHPDDMKQFEGYYNTFYSGCEITALNMTVDFFSEEFRERLAEGYRFLASRPGPYLIHCLEGKERTGFAVAILACLMGADADEVVSDYMLTFYNYYGVEPGTEEYTMIASGNIVSVLEKAFGIKDLYAEGLDLAACAEQYLSGLGMTAEEISALKNCLGADYGGL